MSNPKQVVIIENLGNYATIYSKVSFHIIFLWEVLWGFSTMCNGKFCGLIWWIINNSWIICDMGSPTCPGTLHFDILNLYLLTCLVKNLFISLVKTHKIFAFIIGLRLCWWICQEMNEKHMYAWFSLLSRCPLFMDTHPEDLSVNESVYNSRIHDQMWVNNNYILMKVFAGFMIRYDIRHGFGYLAQVWCRALLFWAPSVFMII